MGMGGAPMRMNGVPPTNAPQRVPIDPALDPLPGPSRANSAAAQGRPTSAALTEKVAGARRKGKGVVRRGRPVGSVNFTPEDVDLLLMMVEDNLPLGQLGWQKVMKDFNDYAINEDRPQRSVDSLKNKFTQVWHALYYF